MKAKNSYQNIYSKAKKNIFIIDDYIDIRNLKLFAKVRKNVKIVIFSDDKKHHLHRKDYDNFRKRFPSVEIDFIKTCGTFHDRFIVLDHGDKNEAVYHCGDLISRMSGDLVKKSVDMLIGTLLKNPGMKLN